MNKEYETKNKLDLSIGSDFLEPSKSDGMINGNSTYQNINQENQEDLKIDASSICAIDKNKTRPQWCEDVVHEFCLNTSKGRLHKDLYERAKEAAIFLELGSIFKTITELWKRRAGAGRLSRRTLAKLEDITEENEPHGIKKSAQQLSKLLIVSKGQKMTEEEYQNLLHTFVEDYVDFIEIGDLDISGYGFRKSSLRLMEYSATPRVRILNSIDEILAEYPELMQRYTYPKIEHYLKHKDLLIRNKIHNYLYKVEKDLGNIRTDLYSIDEVIKKLGIVDAMRSCEGIILHQLNQRAIPVGIKQFLKICGYENPDRVIISALATGKYLWTWYNSEDTINEVNEKLKTLFEKKKSQENGDGTVVDSTESNDGSAEAFYRMWHKKFLGLKKIFTGSALIANSLYWTSLTPSIPTSNQKNATNLLVVASLGMVFMWQGLDDL